jgi:hypothetical protein
MGFTSVGIGSTTNYGFLQFFGTSNTLCWTANGTVGIGTSAPSGRFVIYGTSADSTSPPDNNPNNHHLIITNSKTGTTPYSMALGMDQTYGCGYINAAGNGIIQPVCLQSRGGNVGIGTANPKAPLHIYKAGGSPGNTLQGEIRVCSDDNQISRIGCYEEPDGSTWGGFFQYNGGGVDVIQIGGKANGVDQYFVNISRTTGNVGIGTDNPQVPLHIPRSSTISVGAGGYYFSTGTSIIGFGGNGALATSIRVSDAIVTGASFIAASDIRVKKNIQPVRNSLQIIDQLNIVSYDKIDYLGTGVDAGIIAQDIQDILPRTISKHPSFIPNIYQCATYEDINDDEIRVDVMCNDKDVKEGGRVQLKIVKGDKEESYDTSLYQLTGTSFVIKKWPDFSSDHKVFVYGTEVDDFLSVDKDQIGMLAAAGVKDLHSKVLVHESTIASLQSQNALLLSQNAALQTRMDALEARLNA